MPQRTVRSPEGSIPGMGRRLRETDDRQEATLQRTVVPIFPWGIATSLPRTPKSDQVVPTQWAIRRSGILCPFLRRAGRLALESTRKEGPRHEHNHLDHCRRPIDPVVWRRWRLLLASASLSGASTARRRLPGRLSSPEAGGTPAGPLSPQRCRGLRGSLVGDARSGAGHGAGLSALGFHLRSPHIRRDRPDALFRR